MSNEPVAPGLEPPPPPPAAPPPPSREEQVERVCPRCRPLFCFDEIAAQARHVRREAHADAR